VPDVTGVHVDWCLILPSGLAAGIVHISATDELSAATVLKLQGVPCVRQCIVIALTNCNAQVW
jgi:hypothetical protein